MCTITIGVVTATAAVYINTIQCASIHWQLYYHGNHLQFIKTTKSLGTVKYHTLAGEKDQFLLIKPLGVLCGKEASEHVLAQVLRQAA